MNKKNIPAFIQINKNEHLLSVETPEEIRNLQRVLNDQMKMIEALTSDYLSVFGASPETDVCEVIKLESFVTADVTRETKTFCYSEILKAYARERVHPEDREGLLAAIGPEAILRELKEKESIDHTYRVLVDGVVYYFNAHCVKDSKEGEPMHVIAGFQNIDSIIQKERATREIIHLFEGIFASAPGNILVGTLMVDMDTMHTIRFDRFNGHFKKTDCGNYENYFNYSMGNIFPEDRADVERAICIGRIQEMALDTVSRVSYRGISEIAPGKHHYYETSAQKREMDGRTIVLVFTRDITEQVEEQKAQQEVIEKALAIAEKASQSKTVFLNSISHDIRTPMNAILGFASLAEKHIYEPEELKNDLGKIYSSSNHLLALINDVLDMSRIESGKLVVKERPVYLPGFIEDLKDIVQSDISHNGQSFDVDISGLRDRMVICDKLRLNQILINILSNAIKFTPQGGRIAFEVTQEDTRPGAANYCFTIRDTGIGMSEDFIEHIFEPFEREKTTTVSGVQGTGLGMSITKKLVDLLGGSISVNSKPDVGSEFVVTLELEKCKEELPQRNSELSFDFTGKKVLLVEDNELNREIAEEILEEEGFEIDSVEDGDLAVEKMRTAKPGQYDVILMDIQMPRVNGYEATRQIRKLPDPAAATIPIVAMTANAFMEDRTRAIEAGMNEYVSKPIRIQKLRETLARIL